MSKQIRAVLHSMVCLQDELNIITNGQDWKLKDLNWCLAIAQECAEGIDHLGYKWWAKQLPNIEAARVEVIDMLHFAISHYIARYVRSDLSLATELIADDYLNRYEPFELHDCEADLCRAESKDFFRVLGSMGYMGKTHIGLMFALGERLGMTFDDISRLYRAKLTLNIFRQNNGYKEGWYKKIWEEAIIVDGRPISQTKEDNDFMQMYSEDLDWSLPETPKLLTERLARAYATVTARYERINATN